MSTQTISCSKLYKELGNLLEEVYESGEPIFVTKRGEISGVLPNVEVYEALVNAFDFPSKHRREFLSEFRKSWRAAVERGEWEQLRQTIEDWQATLEVDSEPEVSHYLKLPREKKEYKAWEEIHATVY
ncbi:type II toxin-antitoxin system prevent-host-death family antitoxin [bacterium]|nr:type II toxin-antitoxin system prevent-host-death family antitoxin [bacterium]